MAYTRNLSKTLAEWIAVVAVIFSVISPGRAWGAFASQFSLGIGEEYNDNIFFAKSKVHDFITRFMPTLSFVYAPSGQVEPTGRLSITPMGEIYARRRELSNFGDNISVNGVYAYRYSPQLDFDFSNSLQRQGATRTGSLSEPSQLQTGPTTPGGGFSGAQELRDFVSRGDQITNSFAAHGSYRYKPDISLTAHYTNALASFSDAGGTEVSHTIGARGVYNWRQDHNLHAGYSISINKTRDADNDGVIHNFDFGDDYFSNYSLKLTPTLSLAASTGLSLNTGGDGPRIANSTNITITKLWETAALNAGFRKGLTPSFGVSGVSDTTSLFTNFHMRFSERFSTNTNVTWSSFDTDDVNFTTFQAGIGAQYAITSWLSTALNYRFNWIDSGRGASRTDLLNTGTVNSNTVFLVLTSHFDLWPNTGLARGLTSSALTPVLRTPFSTPSPAPTMTP